MISYVAAGWRTRDNYLEEEYANMKTRKIALSLATILLVFASLACSALQSPDMGLAVDETATAEAPAETATATIPPLLQDVEISAGLLTQEEALVSLYEAVGQGVVSVQVATNVGGGQGSGFVFDELGHIVTNYHVVEDAEYIEIGFTSGFKAVGTIVGIDTDSDLAVIHVDAPADELVPLVFGDSNELRVGQMVVAIGNPFGLTGSMSTGIVSSLGRSLDSLNEAPDSGGLFFVAGDLIQTDAAINPGNSGGPLLNLRGEVVGVNRAIRTFNFNEDGSPLNSGIGFAISSNIVKRVVPALIENGVYEYPYLGISSPPEITLLQAEQLGLDRTTGALVTRVVDGGPADEAGLLEGDLLISVDGRPILTFDSMIGYLFANTSPGDTVTFEVLRNGEVITIDLVLGARP